MPKLDRDESITSWYLYLFEMRSQFEAERINSSQLLYAITRAEQHRIPAETIAKAVGPKLAETFLGNP